MEAPKPISGGLAIDATRFDAAHTLFFDRFRIFPGPFYEMHFGFYGQVEKLQAGLIVLISRQAVMESKQSILQYFQQLGGAMPEPGELAACDLRGDTAVVTADIIGLARHGESLAELTFHIFSWKVVVEKIRAGENKHPLTASCVALLRCDIGLQKRWILDLYEEAAEIQSKDS